MKKTLLILGAGTAGTVLANRLTHALDANHWQIIVVDKDENHYYQPGFLFIPFGMYTLADVVKPRQHFLPPQVELVFSDVEVLDPTHHRVTLTQNHRVIRYDQLIIATGTSIHPEEVNGLADGGGWHHNIFDFYTPEGAVALNQALHNFNGGRLVVNVAEMPIKCPVAPLEFLFLADWYLREKGLRHKTQLVFATPLSGAFTKPRAAAVLGHVLEEKEIIVESEFNIMEVDNGANVIRSYDDREVGYDLLVSIPTHKGADFIEDTGLGDDLNFVRVNKHTLQAVNHENIWAIGDATNVPTSKAGSVAHFMSDTLVHNLVRSIHGKAPEPTFDGHANCFIESGYNKAFLIDFNYETEPLPGKYPYTGIGPFSLLEETTINHRGKMAFRWIYWNVLVKGYPVPVPAQMSMAGKEQ